MTERLALIAGTGALVPEVIAAARKKGFELKVLTLGGRRDIAGYTPVRFSLANPQSAVDAIREFGATAFTMAGGVSLSDVVREGLASYFSGTPTRQSIGDTSISDLVGRLEEMTGARPMGVHEIAPDLLAPDGMIGGPQPTELVLEAARHALDLARRAGALDLGQAVVVAGKRAIAAEDVGGTDGLLRRVRWLRWRGLVADGKTSPLVLAKCPKPDQPLFIDMPAIGLRTLGQHQRRRLAIRNQRPPAQPSDAPQQPVSATHVFVATTTACPRSSAPARRGALLRTVVGCGPPMTILQQVRRNLVHPHRPRPSSSRPTRSEMLVSPMDWRVGVPLASRTTSDRLSPARHA